jgi:4-carboxymuconolactone decarboxylase
MTHLPYADPAYVAEVMHALPDKLDQLELDPKLRELAILRVTHRSHAHDACVQRVALARRVGVTDEQITAIQHPSAGPFSMKEQLGLAFADEVMDAPRVSGALFDQMRSVFSPREIVELLLVVGWYWTIGRLIATLDLEPESGPMVRGTHTVQLSA